MLFEDNDDHEYSDGVLGDRWRVIIKVSESALQILENPTTEVHHSR